MYPQVLAIIQLTFTGRDRTRALGVFGSVIGLGTVGGQLLAAAPLAALFVAHERRVGRRGGAPLGRLDLFANGVPRPVCR
jgi:hypothetical protein